MLDGQHIRIHHGFTQKGQHAVKAFKGLVNHHIACFESGKNRAVLRQLNREAGFERRKQQVRCRHQINQLHQAHQVHRAIDPEHRSFGQAKFLAQKFCQTGRTVGRDFQANCLAIVAVLQALAQGHAQIGDFVLVHRQVRMAGDPELRKLADFTSRKQLGQMGTDHTGQEYKRLATLRHPVRQGNHPRQYTRYLDDGDFVGPPKCVLSRQLHNEVERFVGHFRKGVRRVQAHWHQQRLHLALKVAAHPAALFGIALAM